MSDSNEYITKIYFGDTFKKVKNKKKNKKKKSKVDDIEGISEKLENDPNSEDNSEDLTSDFDNNSQLDGIMKIPPNYDETYEEYNIASGDTTIENYIKVGNDDNVIEPQVIEDEVFNTRALDQYARSYELEKFEKNYLLIFNHKNIINYEPRIGTEKDVKALKETFSKYKFECEDFDDLTKDEIMDKLKKFETEDFTDYGCVAVAVLTHGNKDGLIRAKDREYCDMEIVNYFKTHDKPTLVTKPKLLIIQACRGIRLTPQAHVMRYYKLSMDHDTEVEKYSLPIESDMLILHSSYIGSPSVRCEVTGSWFIQTLCKKIDEYSERLDLESILTEVKREVAIDLHYNQYNRATFEIESYKQMPVITSTLIRKLYLKKRSEEKITQTDGQESGQLECLPSLATGSQVQYRPAVTQTQCTCYLNYFAYIKTCLQYYLEKNPDDKVAQSYFDISNTYRDTEEFSAPKQTMIKVICDHLTHNANTHEYYKLIYKNEN